MWWAVVEIFAQNQFLFFILKAVFDFLAGRYRIIWIGELDLQCQINNFAYLNWNWTKNVYMTSPNQIFESVNKQNLSIFNGSTLNLLPKNDQDVHFVPLGHGKIFPNIEVHKLHAEKLT